MHNAKSRVLKRYICTPMSIQHNHNSQGGGATQMSSIELSKQNVRGCYSALRRKC